MDGHFFSEGGDVLGEINGSLGAEAFDPFGQDGLRGVVKPLPLVVINLLCLFQISSE